NGLTALSKLSAQTHETPLAILQTHGGMALDAHFGNAAGVMPTDLGELASWLQKNVQATTVSPYDRIRAYSILEKIRSLAEVASDRPLGLQRVPEREFIFSVAGMPNPRILDNFAALYRYELGTLTQELVDSDPEF